MILKYMKERMKRRGWRLLKSERYMARVNRKLKIKKKSQKTKIKNARDQSSAQLSKEADRVPSVCLRIRKTAKKIMKALNYQSVAKSKCKRVATSRMR